MSEPYDGVNKHLFYQVNCPYCKADRQEVEDLGDHPSYLSGECWKCGKWYSVDLGQEEYYDEKGDKLK